MPTPGRTVVAPLKSHFASDPEMIELIEVFASEMPERINSLSAAWREQNMDELRRLANHMKGACGGYGFSSLGEAAAELEETIGLLSRGSASATNEDLRNRFEELIDLCRRVRA